MSHCHNHNNHHHHHHHHNHHHQHATPEQRKVSSMEMPFRANGNNNNANNLPRNGSITPPFEENGVTSPLDAQISRNGSGVDLQQHHMRAAAAAAAAANSINSLGTSVDSALLPTGQQQQQLFQQQQQQALLAKNRFASGDLNTREALVRRRLFSIGEHQKLGWDEKENDPTNPFSETDQSLNRFEKDQRRAALVMELTGQQQQQQQQQQANPHNGVGPPPGLFQMPTNFESSSFDSIGE